MNRGSILFLKAVLVLIGIGALALMLWEPHVEGRNAHATLYEIYFKDPFLAYAYIASIPFFLALYQAFKVLGYAGQNQVFSQAAVKALRTIKFCALALIGFVAVGELFTASARERHDCFNKSLIFAQSSSVIAPPSSAFVSRIFIASARRRP